MWLRESLTLPLHIPIRCKHTYLCILILLWSQWKGKPFSWGISDFSLPNCILLQLWFVNANSVSTTSLLVLHHLSLREHKKKTYSQKEVQKLTLPYLTIKCLKSGSSRIFNKNKTLVDAQSRAYGIYLQNFHNFKLTDNGN